MQIQHIVSCLVLMITVGASYIKAEDQNQELQEHNNEKRINKREATMIIDNFPMESVYHKPKVVYRRISRVTRQRYGPPKPKYGPPRPKYGPPKARKPGKKYYGKIKPRYGPPSHKKRKSKPKPRYGPPKRLSKPVYGPPKKIPYNPYVPEVSGFGEPPIDFSKDTPSNTYGEPPVDSYGVPVKDSLKDIFQTPSKYKDTSNPFDGEYNNFGEEYQSWSNFQQDKNIDNIYALTKKHPKFVKPKPEVFVTPGPDFDEENFVSYSDVYTYKQREKGKKPQLHDSKFVNKPWKLRNKKPIDNDEEIIVGGQYAEPPARYITKFQPSGPMADEAEFPKKAYVDPEVTESATNSPYVNYKNSNVAFNPQNLNDAFSIPEK